MAMLEGWTRANKVVGLVFLGLIAVSVGMFGFVAENLADHAQMANVRSNGDVHAEQSYLDTGPDPTSADFKNRLSNVIIDAHRPFDKFVRIVTLFIKHGADPNDVLRMAEDAQKTELAKVAIADGADVNKRYGDGRTPLFVAKSLNDMPLIKMLKAAGAKK